MKKIRCSNTLILDFIRNYPLLNYMLEGLLNILKSIPQAGNMGKYLTKIITKYSGHGKEKKSVTYVVVLSNRFRCQRSGITADKPKLKTASLSHLSTLAQLLSHVVDTG